MFFILVYLSFKSEHIHVLILKIKTNQKNGLLYLKRRLECIKNLSNYEEFFLTSFICIKIVILIYKLVRNIKVIIFYVFSRITSDYNDFLKNYYTCVMRTTGWK